MQIFKINLSKLNKSDFIDDLKKSEKKSLVFTPNPEILLNAKNDPEFLDILNKWDYLIPDWIGIYAWFQILESKLPKIINFLLIPYYWLNLFIKRKALYKKYWDKICWSDLVKTLIENANSKKLWVSIIDKYQAPWDAWDNLKIERQKITAKLLKEKYPWADFHYYIYTKEAEEDIINTINNTEDIYLFSSQWLKHQEITLFSMMPKLNNIKVAIGIWWSFDMILWFKKRAPKIVISLWLEWLWRFIIDPKRMAKRIWKALFVFLFEVIKSKKD